MLSTTTRDNAERIIDAISTSTPNLCSPQGAQLWWLTLKASTVSYVLEAQRMGIASATLARDLRTELEAADVYVPAHDEVAGHMRRLNEDGDGSFGVWECDLGHELRALTDALILAGDVPSDGAGLLERAKTDFMS